MSEPSQSTNITIPANSAAAQAFYGAGSSQTNSTWIIMAFVAFLVIVWGIWRGHSQSSDEQNTLTRAIDAQAFQAGLANQKLADLQQSVTLERLASTQYREAELRFGAPVGVHTVALGSGRSRGAGNIVNGGGITDTFQADNSVF